MKLFHSKKPHYEFLRKKWIARHQEATQNIFDKHLRHVALSSLGGLMLLSTPNLTTPVHLIDSSSVGTSHNMEGESSQNRLLASELVDKLPREVRKLDSSEENKVIELIQKDLKIKVASEIDGKRLNRSYGLIGGEQHLYRYPGDDVYQHAKSASDWAMFGSAGIAPGLGAWGYFAPSKDSFTKEDEERERYYIAVQTFLSPGFAERVGEYRDFYKYRKLLVVNVKTGQAVIAVIGDAGPSEWTGKSLGGSPEVMHELGLASGPRKGEVLYFFIDESQKDLPLGPVKAVAEKIQT